MKGISTAPKDRAIRISNPENGLKMDAIWNKKTKRWEGKIFNILGVVNIYWDRSDEIQPTHWEELNA
jgi:hypothetical protein